MKKVFVSLLALFALLVFFTSCSKQPDTIPPSASPDELPSETLPPETPPAGNGNETDAEDDVFYFKLSEVHNSNYHLTLADMEFARLVKERTQGRVVIEVFTDGRFGDERVVAEQLQTGSLDFARLSLSPVADFYKPLNVLMLPYMYRDNAHMMDVLNSSIGDSMLEGLSYADLIGLTWYETGPRNFFATKEIRSPDDVKGLTVRVQDSQLMVDMIELLGATPITNLAIGDLYASFQTGLIQCAENDLTTYKTMSLQEVAKYLILDRHTTVPGVLLASPAAMSRLSEEDQKIIRECAKESQSYQIQKWQEQETAALQSVTDNGAVIIELSDDELDAFREQLAPLYEGFDEYKEIIEQIKSFDKQTENN